MVRQVTYEHTMLRLQTFTHPNQFVHIDNKIGVEGGTAVVATTRGRPLEKRRPRPLPAVAPAAGYAGRRLMC